MDLRIETKRECMDLKRIMHLLNQTYWASKRSKEVMERAMDTSECIAVFNREVIVGFSRVVTDYATMFWLCDVVVDIDYRGHGIGKMMLEFIEKQPYYSTKGLLATKDAHGLYEQFGFHREEKKMMMKDRDDG